MATFKEANQVRLGLKMKLSNFNWYVSSAVISNNEDYYVLIIANQIDNNVRKIVAPVIDGVDIKTEAKVKRHK